MYVKLAVDDDGKVKVSEEGLPMFVTDKEVDGKPEEVAVNVPQMYSKIIELGKENKTSRETNQAQLEVLNLFEGIDDVGEWKISADKAIEQVANFDDKDWLKADKVEKMKSSMKEAHEIETGKIKEQFNSALGEKDDVIGKKEGQIRKLMVSSSFAKHSLFSGEKPKTNLPPEIAETYFGQHFKVEEVNGELVVRGYFTNGDIVYAVSNPGEPADFNEAMGLIFDVYPGRDKLLRASPGGSGAGGGGGAEETSDDIATLEKEHAEAIAAGAASKAISLKNKIFQLKQAKRSRAA